LGIRCDQKKFGGEPCISKNECFSDKCQNRKCSGPSRTGSCPTYETNRSSTYSSNPCGCVASTNLCEGSNQVDNTYRNCVSDSSGAVACANGYVCKENQLGFGYCVQEEIIVAPLFPRGFNVNDLLTRYNYNFGTSYNLTYNVSSSCGSGSGLSCINDPLVSACVTVNQTNYVSQVQVCSFGYYCDSSGQSYSCVAKKSDAQTCSADYECSGGTCRSDECVSGAVPSITSCSSNSDCSVNQTCDSGACKKTTAQGCSISSECLSNNCVSGNCSRSCNRDSDCSNNYDCSSGMCKAPDNSACITNNQCQGGNCTNSKCISQACTRDSDCASNYECTNNKCVEIEEETTGLSCNDVSGIVCSTGKCINGALSTNTREINCCVSSGQGTLGCEGAPQYISALSSAIRFDKSCLSNGMSEVKVVDVSNENRQFTQDELSALGLTSQTYTEQDYSCGGITVSPKEAQTVNGYSLMALLVSFAILFAYYFWNKK